MKVVYEAILVLSALTYEILPIFPFYTAGNFVTPSGIGNYYDALFVAGIPVGIVINLYRWYTHLH